jgi:hypothetical protein
MERRPHMHGLRIGAVATVALAFACAALAVPAGATGVPTTGTRVTLGQCVATPCESTLPAREPFFIEHGFVDSSRDVLVNPRTRFELSVDGALVPATVVLDLTGAEPSKLYLTNFRFGLTGVHTFVGCWYADGALLFCGTRTIAFTG